MAHDPVRPFEAHADGMPSSARAWNTSQYSDVSKLGGEVTLVQLMPVTGLWHVQLFTETRDHHLEEDRRSRRLRPAPPILKDLEFLCEQQKHRKASTIPGKYYAGRNPY